MQELQKEERQEEEGFDYCEEKATKKKKTGETMAEQQRENERDWERGEKGWGTYFLFE